MVMTGILDHTNDHRNDRQKIADLTNENLQKVGFCEYRVDYLKLHFVADFDYYQDMIVPQVREVDAYLSTLDNHSESRTTALGHLEGGRRGYIVEWYGEAADKAVLMLPDRMLHTVTRIDLRTTVPDVTDEGIDLLADYLRKNAQGNRNLTQYDTRKRTKKNGRHAGGKGVAFGSHKSDKRLTWYKRNGEPAALEVQIQGQKSVQLVRDAVIATKGENPVVRYATVCGLLVSELLLKLRECGFSTFEDMHSFIVAQEPTLRDLKELEVHQLAVAYQNLSPAQQLDFFKLAFGSEG